MCAVGLWTRLWTVCAVARDCDESSTRLDLGSADFDDFLVASKGGSQ